MTKAKEITNDITQNIKTQKVIFFILVSGSVIMFALYIFLIGTITFNVIARKSLENTVVKMTGEVNQLELTYLNNINKIDKEYVISKGFVDVRQNIFAARNINHVAIR